MGDFRVRKINDDYDRKKMYDYALDDIEAFEILLKENMFADDQIHIGAEQEICVVDEHMDPATRALDILANIEDEHFTNELALFNMEINTDPLPLKADCFSQMENSLVSLMEKGRSKAAELDTQLFITGILPTLKFRHLQFEYMTPIKRYQTLSQSLFDLRGQNFEIYLQGTDELIMSLSSVLFEACNTSFQTHLQIKPSEFVDKHNWAQMIAGPVLSTTTNSPLLFGNELWHETRIALFKQSLDTRSSAKMMRRKLPRVYFGSNWIQNSATDLWKNDIMRFPLILTSDDYEYSTEKIKQGHIPDLRAIRLHNGTTYTWNRLCYGHSEKSAHLRIECRYIPAGPTIKDEFANFAYWIGLMHNQNIYGPDFWKTTDFKCAKNNFIKAARTGFNTVFGWFGENLTAQKLTLDKLLPMAKDGLVNSGVNSNEADKYLSTIEKRAEKHITGSQWMIQNYRKLAKKYNEISAQKSIVKQSIEYQNNNVPLHEWEDISHNLYFINHDEELVEEHMSKDIFAVHTNDSVELCKKILKWNDIHHLPVENLDGDLVGMITDGVIDRIEKMKERNLIFASQIMIINPMTVQADDTLADAKEKMINHNISGLPVVFNRKLVGIITNNDILD